MTDENLDKKKKKGSLKSKLFWFIFIIASILLLRQTCILLLIGMLPTLVVKMVDEDSDRIWTKTIFCFNFAGVYPYLVDIVLNHGNAMRELQTQMADGMTWLIIYGSAGIGYLSLWFCPIFAEFAMRIISHKRLKNHTNKMHSLKKEWNIK